MLYFSRFNKIVSGRGHKTYPNPFDQLKRSKLKSLSERFSPTQSINQVNLNTALLLSSLARLGQGAYLSLVISNVTIF